MAKEPYSPRNIDGKLLVLGTGTSVGVPALGCGCEVCRSNNPRNKRTRCSVILGLPAGHLLVDTSPDLRTQLLREQIGIVHAVAFTHEHADHIFGLDDLRLFPFYLGHPVPLYCETHVEARLRQSYDYAFSDVEQTHVGAVPQLKFETITTEPFEALETTITPIRMQHGPRFEVLGFRVGNVAYCTDTNEIPPESVDRLQGLDTLILGALRPTPHPTHFSLDEAVAMAEELGAKQTYFTHCSCRLEYEDTNAKLPEGIKMAHDGLEIELT